MRTHRRVGVALAVVAMLCGGARAIAHAAPPKQTVEAIRNELLTLPYYGVFDYLAFGYDKGTVTLVGYTRTARR